MAVTGMLLACCLAGAGQAPRRFLTINWPVSARVSGRMTLDLREGKPLFQNIGLLEDGSLHSIVRDTDPLFLLTVGKRDLVSQNGWNIFFDKVPLKPYDSYTVHLTKKNARVVKIGSRTVIRIGALSAPDFSGWLEITLYDGSSLFNIAAVMSTKKDSVAILYDAGLVSRDGHWDHFSWADTEDRMQQADGVEDTARNEKVKYRTIIASDSQGSLAIFPPPHQFFYPLDEAFNLSFVWHGGEYRKMTPGYGMGIRQDLHGDHRYVPWFNAPPGTQQRMSFFCLLGVGNAPDLLDSVKKFTHADRYIPLDGYKTMASHFHNEYVMKVMLAPDPGLAASPGGTTSPTEPGFVQFFKSAGIDIVHLAEFHYTAHPKGPDEQRLNELRTLFQLCRSVSSDRFLLLPGEEPNEFFGGHWLELFPRPVYWIMARKSTDPFVTDDPVYGKVYRVGNAAEMLELLEKENGLAWTAHPRTKGSTGFPDAYKKEAFFQSEHWLGGAWKAMPADLSQPRLGRRALDLLDDMNNWGVKMQVLSEADLFSVTPDNEMYAHLNVNYLKLPSLPSFADGWQPVLDVLRKGGFFSTTGEVLIPDFRVMPSRGSERSGATTVAFRIRWTFPLNFAEIISGDGVHVYRDRLDLNDTRAYGEQTFYKNIGLTGRKWVRLEVWDVAADGAFTQTIWLR